MIGLLFIASLVNNVMDKILIKNQKGLINALTDQNNFLAKHFLQLLLNDSIAKEDYITAQKCKDELEKLK